MKDSSGLTQSQYYDFFNGLPPDKSDEYLLNKDRLQEYRIRVASQGQYRNRSYQLRLLHIFSRGRVVDYLAMVGPFQMRLIVLHQNKASPNSRSDTPFGSGGFGKIYLRKLCSSDFAGKVVRYNSGISSREDINEIIREVVMYKLCSFFEIGPKVETRIPFDLICYTDCAQFHMERCKSLEQSTPVQKSTIAQNLKSCLQTLHKNNLVHRDIKPDNVLFVRRLNKFVLSDFGLTQYVKQNVGEATEVYSEGTYRYMVKALKEIKQGQTGYVDLYHADLYALQKTLDDIRDGYICKKHTVNHHNSQDFMDYGSQESSNISESNAAKEAPQSSKESTEDESYEYYRVLFAVTSLFDSDFNLQENWNYISDSKKEEILNLLICSLSTGKVRKFLNEYRAMSIHNEEPSVTELIGRLRSKHREFKQPVNFEPVPFSVSEIQLCRRTFKSDPQLKAIEERLKKNLHCDYIQIIAVLTRLFDAQTRVSYTFQQWQKLLSPLNKYLNEKAVKATYQILISAPQNSYLQHYLRSDLLTLAQSSAIDQHSKQYFSFMNLYSYVDEEPRNLTPQKIGFAVKDVKRITMIYFIMSLNTWNSEIIQQWGRWLMAKYTINNQGLELEHAKFLGVVIDTTREYEQRRSVEEALAILMGNRIHNSGLLLILLMLKVRLFLDKKQHLQALQAIYACDEVREYYFCLINFQERLNSSRYLRAMLNEKRNSIPHPPQMFGQILSEERRLLNQMKGCLDKEEWDEAENLHRRIKERLVLNPYGLIRLENIVFLLYEAHILSIQQHYEQAINSCHKAIAELSMTYSPSKRQIHADCLFTCAANYLKMKDQKRANMFLLQAEQMDRLTTPYPSLRTLNIYIGLSILYETMGQEKMCRKWIRRSEVLLKKGVKAQPFMYVKLLELQATRRSVDKQYASTISKLKLQVKIALKEQIKLELNISQQYLKIGLYFQLLEDHIKAITYLSKGLELEETMLTAIEKAQFIRNIFLSYDSLENKEYAEFLQFIFDLLKVQLLKDSALYIRINKILDKSCSSAYKLSVAHFTSLAAKAGQQIEPLERAARIRAKSALVTILRMKTNQVLRKLAVLLALEVSILYRLSREMEKAIEYLEKASIILATLTPSKNEEDIQERHLIRKFVVLQHITLLGSV